MRAARHTAAIVVAALVAGCGGHPKAATKSPQPMPVDTKLVVVGDSLTAGRFADSQDDAFPQQVAAAIHAQLEPLGVVGATTAQLTAQPIPGGGNVVVVEAGTNDFLFQTSRRQFADDYRALLAKVTAASPGAKLVCLTTWVPKDAAAQPAAKVPPSSYDATIRRACTAGTVANISSLPDAQPPTRGPAGRNTFLGPGDDFHPNSTGHAAIARLIEARLR
jgi:acyl-CoA thioesterase-1